jgi:hypothetical protein
MWRNGNSTADLVRALHAELCALRSDADRLEVRLAELTTAAEPIRGPAPGQPPPPRRRFGRRALLGRAGAVLVTGAAMAIAEQAPAAAGTDGDLTLGVENHEDSNTTTLRSSTFTGVLLDLDCEKGTGLNVSGDTSVRASGWNGQGVNAYSQESNAVEALIAGDNPYNAVYGHVESGSGNAVFGEMQSATGSGAGVLGISHGPGNSVFGYKPASASGDAVVGVNDCGGSSVRGYKSASATGDAVNGAHDGDGVGVHGTSVDGHGVFGEAQNSIGDRAGVLGISHGSGNSVFGYKPAAASGDAVVGVNDGGGSSVRGFKSASATGDAVTGAHEGSGAGVHGKSVGGRGGVFVGKLAGIRLTPTAQLTHPTKGLAGDLVVDKNNELWFCKGGTSWVKIA